MLPYIEQGPIYNAINFNFCSGYHYGGMVNITSANRLIAAYMCPSDNNVGFGGAPNSNHHDGYSLGRNDLSALYQQLPGEHRDHDVDLGMDNRV